VTKFSDLPLLLKSPRKYLIKIRREEILQNIWRLFIYFLSIEVLTCLILALKISKILSQSPFLFIGMAVVDLLLSLVAIIPFLFYLKLRKLRMPLRLGVNILVFIKLGFLSVFYIGFCCYILSEAFVFYFFYSWLLFIFEVLMPLFFVLLVPCKRLLLSVLSIFTLSLCFVGTIGMLGVVLFETMPNKEILTKYNGLSDFVLQEQIEVGDDLRDKMSVAVYDPEIIDFDKGSLKNNGSEVISIALSRLDDFKQEISKQRSEAVFFSTTSLIDKFQKSYQLTAKYYLALQQFFYKYQDGIAVSDRQRFLQELKSVYSERDTKAILASVESLNQIYRDAQERKNYLVIYLF
jgi:hypothetical protein